MYLPYQFKHQANQQLFLNYTKQQGIEQHLIYSLTEALNGISGREQQLDFFLGANAATQGGFYSSKDAIKLMSNQDYKNMFVVYWHLCAGNDKSKLPDWVIKCRPHSHRLDELENTMKKMLNLTPEAENEPIQIDDFNDIVGARASQNQRANYYKIAKISSLTLLAIGVAALGFGFGCYFASPLPWINEQAISIIIYCATTAGVGGLFGFFATRQAQKNDLFFGGESLLSNKS